MQHWADQKALSKASAPVKSRRAVVAPGEIAELDEQVKNKWSFLLRKGRQASGQRESSSHNSSKSLEETSQMAF
jgi:3-deoxy-D-arabino-heptulosonate 7-phosphate (DAHP) synthase class II